MGVDIHVKITKYNPETNYFEPIELYRKRKPNEHEYNPITDEKIEKPSLFVKVPIYEGRNYEMFDGMKNGDEIDGYGCFPKEPIAMNSLEPNIKEEINRYKNIQGYYDFYEVNLADLENYLEEYPEVTDYDSKEEPGKKTNPIKYFVEDIKNYLTTYDSFEYYYTAHSYYKILFWFDC